MPHKTIVKQTMTIG